MIWYPEASDEEECHNRCTAWLREIEHDHLDDGTEFALQEPLINHSPHRWEFYQANTLDKGWDQMFGDASDCSTVRTQQTETDSDHGDVLL